MKKKCHRSCCKTVVICETENGTPGENGQNGTNGLPGPSGVPGTSGIPSSLNLMVYSAIPATAQSSVFFDNQPIPYTQVLFQNPAVATFQSPGWIISPGSYLMTI